MTATTDSPQPTTDRVAVVTGASRGLGFLMARELARRGHALVVCARHGAGLAIAAQELRRHGTAVVEVVADLSQADQARKVIDEAQNRFGRLDVLVANAGIIQVGPAEQMGTDEFAEIMGSTLWGSLVPTLAALPMLRRTKGRVLAITSIGGKLPAPHLLPYTTAKHAAVGFFEGLHIEAARQDVSVTVGVPGLMRTGSTRNALFAGNREYERRWFTVAASLPLVSMNAERAARKLVEASMRRRAEVVLTPLARVGIRVHGVAPATTLRMLKLINRLLPRPVEASPPRPGHLARSRDPRWFTGLTGLDRRAARRWHQRDDPAPDRQSPSNRPHDIVDD